MDVSLEDLLFNLFDHFALEGLFFIRIVALHLESDQDGCKNHHQTYLQIETSAFFEVSFGIFLEFHIIVI